MTIYQYAFGNRFSMLLNDAVAQRHTRYRHLFCNDLDDVFIYVLNGYETTYFSNHDVRNLTQKGKRLFEQEFSKRLQAEIKKVITEYNQFVKKYLKESYSRSTNQELCDIFDRLMDLVIKTAACFTHSRPEPMKAMEDKIAWIARNISNNPKPVVELLLTPDKPGIFLKEKEDWLKLCKKPTKANLGDFSIKYAYLFLNTYSKTEALGYLHKRIKETDKTALAKEIKSDKAKLRQIAKEQKAIIKKNNELNYVSGYIKQAAGMRFYMRNIFSGYEYVFLPLLREIAKRRKMNVMEMLYSHSINNIRDFLLNNKKISESDVSQRKKEYGLWVYQGKIYFLAGTKLNDFVKNRLRGLVPDPLTRLIRGQTAFPGRVIGKVHKLMSDDIVSIQKISRIFKKGDILVCPNTVAIVTPLMKRAGAIVTDEGGIASHAAIVSREFRIPAVIGTHIATKVLHEGDIVEVDANKGIVRKIK